jgi:hypothetical protein
MKYINEEEKFWRHSYKVHLSEFDLTGVCVNADNESDALDFAINYHENQGHMGLFIDNPTEEDFDNKLIGGNHSLVLSSDNIIITQLD